jgi:hypothetical protein
MSIASIRRSTGARSALVLVLLGATGCATAPPPLPNMNDIAERYVKLVLLAGQHDSDFVDAYYGDAAWKPAGAPVPLDDLAARARALRAELEQAALPPGAEEAVQLRRTYLDRQLAAVETRLAMLKGQKFSFDDESRRLYDAEAPRKSEDEFRQVIDELGRLLPGRGPVEQRYAEYRKAFVIPPAKLDAVFRAAIAGCRARTVARMALPPEETFLLEYVTGKSWSAYNWYKGGFTSVIQVNTDLPITIDRAIDLACHEGYPGHHVYNVLLEHTLVKGRGWVEFSVYPLFSPQSLVAEGTANLGVEIAFPGGERTAFERDTLYPLAGLDPATASSWAAVQHLVDQLSYAGNEAARRYLNGEIDRAAAAAWLERFAMMPADRALQRTKFFDQYRSYVINYNLGRDLARRHVESRGGTADKPVERWREFGKLLASPRLLK